VSDLLQESNDNALLVWDPAIPTYFAEEFGSESARVLHKHVQRTVEALVYPLLDRISASHDTNSSSSSSIIILFINDTRVDAAIIPDEEVTLPSLEDKGEEGEENGGGAKDVRRKSDGDDAAEHKEAGGERTKPQIYVSSGLNRDGIVDDDDDGSCHISSDVNKNSKHSELELLRDEETALDVAKQRLRLLERASSEWLHELRENLQIAVAYAAVFAVALTSTLWLLYTLQSVFYLALTVLAISSLVLVALWLLFPQFGHLVLKGLQFIYPYVLFISRSLLSIVVGIILVIYVVEFMRYIAMFAGRIYICCSRTKS